MRGVACIELIIKSVWACVCKHVRNYPRDRLEGVGCEATVGPTQTYAFVRLPSSVSANHRLVQVDGQRITSAISTYECDTIRNIPV